MPLPAPIRILETDNNRRGDLFVSLGFEQPRLNVHKSGRELDIETNHRLEPRRAIAECKATADPIGGDDLNKLVGALDAEHGALVEQGHRLPATGYFISLSGFTEPALDQERHRARTKIVTLHGAQVVDELIRGRMLIPRHRATELAGRLCAAHGHLALDPDTELLAHQRGWIWAVRYIQGKSPPISRSSTRMARPSPGPSPTK